jgi:hypothetical protein
MVADQCGDSETVHRGVQRGRRGLRRRLRAGRYDLERTMKKTGCRIGNAGGRVGQPIAPHFFIGYGPSVGIQRRRSARRADQLFRSENVCEPLGFPNLPTIPPSVPSCRSPREERRGRPRQIRDGDVGRSGRQVAAGEDGASPCLTCALTSIVTADSS